MAFQAGNYHYFGFYVGTTGLTTVDFTIDVFTVDGVAVDAPTLASFEVIEVSGGYYYAKYLPSKAGFYFIGIHRLALHFADSEDISESEFVVNLTQNTGGANALRPAPFKFLSAGGNSPTLAEYLLMVFQSEDWDVGRKANTFAVAMTKLDVNGNWLTSPLVVSPGTYHIIIRNNFGATKVIKPNLEVGE